MKRLIGIFLIVIMLVSLLISFAACSDIVVNMPESGVGKQESNTLGGKDPYDDTVIDDVTNDNYYTPKNTHVGIEFSIAWMEPAIVTYDDKGNRISEQYRDGGMRYLYNKDLVLCGIKYSTLGSDYVLTCEFGENGLPNRADITEGGEKGELFFLFEYSENGKLRVMKRGYTNFSTSTEHIRATYTFDENGVTRSIAPTDEDIYEMTYADNNVIKVEYRMWNELKYLLEFTYDANDRIVSYSDTTYTSSGEIHVLDSHEFIYENNNCKYTNYRFYGGEKYLFAKILYNEDWKEINYERSRYDSEGSLTEKDIFDGNTRTEEEYLNDYGEVYLSKRKITRWDEKGSILSREEQNYSSRGFLLSRSLRYTDNDGRDIEEYYEVQKQGEEPILTGKNISVYDYETDTRISEYFRYDENTKKMYLYSRTTIKNGNEEIVFFDPNGNII